MQVAILSAGFCKRPVKKEGFFFPVAIIYNGFLTNCHWEQYFYNIAAGVTDDPSQELDNLISQGESGGPPCTTPAISKGVKKKLIALFICLCWPEIFPFC